MSRTSTAGALVCSVFLLIAALVLLGLQLWQTRVMAHKTFVPIPSKRLVVVGTGLSAASFLFYLAPPLRAAVGVREATTRFGGRVLSGQQAIQPVSTQLPMNEFGAWEYDAFKHGLTLTFLQALQVPILPHTYVPAQSFTHIAGIKTPWPTPPTTPPDHKASYGSLGEAAAAAVFAYTGIPQAEALTASLAAVATSTLPTRGGVPAGMGWTDVALRGCGLAYIQYGQKLDRISSAGPKLVLHYASGMEEEVGSAILTCAPHQLLEIAGVLPTVTELVRASLLGVTQGVIYATWGANDVWWPALGFTAGVAATDTALGTVAVASPGVLRCLVVGEAAVAAWTTAFVSTPLEAVKTQIVTLLAQVFGQQTLPSPAAVSFRSWPNSLWLWKAGVDVAATRAVLSRPCGSDVPVFWASGDLSDVQNRVEGCVQAGLAAAAIAPSLVL